VTPTEIRAWLGITESGATCDERVTAALANLSVPVTAEQQLDTFKTFLRAFGGSYGPQAAHNGYWVPVDVFDEHRGMRFVTCRWDWDAAKSKESCYCPEPASSTCAVRRLTR
jgi:hypothetical protein